MARTLRWQLYDRAIEQGLQRRSGGYSVDFLRNFLKVSPPPPIDFRGLLFDKFSSLGDFILASDHFEGLHDIKTLSEARKHHRDITKIKFRFRSLKKQIKAIDKEDIATGVRNKPK